MLVYTTYRWFRRKRRGPIERERQRACVIVVAFVYAICVSSGTLSAFNRAANRMLGSLFFTSEQSVGASPLQTP